MKWCGKRGGWLLGLVFGLALAALPGRTQTVPPKTTTFEGIQVPEYDDQGRLKSRLFGDRAEMQPDGRIRITNLRIQIYKEGVEEAKVWAERCLFNRKDKSAISDSAVRLEKGNMRVTGTGMRWLNYISGSVILASISRS